LKDRKHKYKIQDKRKRRQKDIKEGARPDES
jgi:hypothetical protein